MLNLISNILSLGAGIGIGSQASLRIACTMNPRPMPHQFAGALDHSLRLRYRHVGDTLGLYGFGAGMTVLDLGCGSGLFTAEMARMVGATGQVHALDLQAPMVEATRQRIAEAGLDDRVQFHHAGAYNLPLADQSIDLAVIIATLGEIPDRSRALAETWRVLKPGGRLAVSEELLDPAFVLPNVVRRWAEDVGFQFIGKTGSLFCYHMILTRP